PRHKTASSRCILHHSHRCSLVEIGTTRAHHREKRPGYNTPRMSRSGFPQQSSANRTVALHSYLPHFHPIYPTQCNNNATNKQSNLYQFIDIWHGNQHQVTSNRYHLLKLFGKMDSSPINVDFLTH